jgi:hypothetical protein
MDDVLKELRRLQQAVSATEHARGGRCCDRLAHAVEARDEAAGLALPALLEAYDKLVRVRDAAKALEAGHEGVCEEGDYYQGCGKCWAHQDTARSALRAGLDDAEKE